MEEQRLKIPHGPYERQEYKPWQSQDMSFMAKLLLIASNLRDASVGIRTGSVALEEGLY